LTPLIDGARCLYIGDTAYRQGGRQNLLGGS
jgi:hypothetical protein